MPTYTITELPPLDPGDGSFANDINDQGNAAGSCLWEGTTPHALPPPQKGWTAAYSLNDTWEVVGYVAGLPLEHAFYYGGSGQIQDLSQVLRQIRSWAADINDSGVVVGTVGNGLDFGAFRPFIYSTKSGGPPVFLEPLSGDNGAFGCAINSAGDVAGVSASDDFDYHIFLFSNGVMRDLGADGITLGVTNTDVDLNDGGVITGSLPNFAFRIDSSAANPTFESLPALPDQANIAGSGSGFAINNAGVVVGSYVTTHPNPPYDKAFVNFPSTSEEAGSYDLNSPNVVTNLGDWALWTATGINNEGQIVGWGTHQSDPQNVPPGPFQFRAFRLDPQPSVDPREFNRIEGLLAGFLMIFGGAVFGGPGKAIPFHGPPIPIPPHEPLASIWKRLLPAWKGLSQPERDILVGSVVRKLALLTQDPANRKLLEQTGRAVITSAIEKLERGK
jgi:probable HAF family extracellular repeat protein